MQFIFAIVTNGEILGDMLAIPLYLPKWRETNKLKCHTFFGQFYDILRALQEKSELLHNHRALKMNKNTMKFKMQT